MQWIPSEKKEQSDAIFDGQVTDVYLIDGHALPPSAIHEALAQPKQEPVAWELRAGKTDRVLIEITNNPQRAHDWKASLEEVVPLYTTPPQRKPEQEPVVFFRTDNGWKKEAFEKTLVKKVPLDTTPPTPHVWFDFSNVPLDATSPQRKWVGLTDAEITELHHEIKVRLMGTYKTEDIYRAIEAKLREKNGG